MAQKKNKVLTDLPIPFGEHKNSKIANAPNDYFRFLYENNIKEGNLKNYIENNIEAIYNNTNIIKDIENNDT